MWQSLLVYNACPQPQTEATVLVSPFLLQIDIFGKQGSLKVPKMEFFYKSSYLRFEFFFKYAKLSLL